MSAFTPAQRERLERAAASLGIELGDEGVAKFERLTGLLLEWNERVNLTALKTVDDIVDKHYIDSLYGHPLLPPNGFVLDIGTGAGFPGVPLKIAAPERRLLCIDGTGKKITFVQTVIKDLGLKNITAMHQRAEDKAFIFGLRGQFDGVTARAVTDTAALAALAEPYLKKGGVLVLFKGTDEAEAMRGKSFPGFGAAKLHAYVLPAGDKRALLELIKK